MNGWNWNNRGKKGLIANVFVALVLVLLANAFIFFTNAGEESAGPDTWLAPPGWAIGVVWTLLFTALGFARWLVIERDDRRVRSSTWVLLLLLFCAAYPACTFALRSLTMGLAGNIATIAAALWVSKRVYRASALAASLVFAVVAWVSFATFLILEQLGAHRI